MTEWEVGRQHGYHGVGFRPRRLLTIRCTRTFASGVPPANAGDRSVRRLAAVLLEKGVRKMKTDEIKEVVKTRYGKFAETGGHKEPC